MASTTSTTGRATWRIYMKWALRVVGAIVGLVMVLMLVGAAYQTITTARDASNYPPPGKLIDVGGHRLHLYCTGQGSPTVVMDAMGGASSLAWVLVQLMLRPSAGCVRMIELGWAGVTLARLPDGSAVCD